MLSRLQAKPRVGFTSDPGHSYFVNPTSLLPFTCFLPAAAMMEVEACRVLPGQMVQTISVDVGDAAAVEKAMSEAVAKQGAVQVRSLGLSTDSSTGSGKLLAVSWIVLK